MPKICRMDGVREHCEGDPVELWREDDKGRLVIRAYGESGNCCTEVDLFDVVDWLSAGPNKRLLENHISSRDKSDRESSQRN
jgi:hypothetical protein